jgi:hypothetical protein
MWNNCAAIMKRPIIIEEIKTRFGNQIPRMSKVDKAILIAPTKLLVKSLKLN